MPPTILATAVPVAKGGDGGGVWHSGEITINSCVFTGNLTGNGGSGGSGGINAYGGNGADGGRGAGYGNFSGLSNFITGCTFSDNQTGNGGAAGVGGGEFFGGSGNPGNGGSGGGIEAFGLQNVIQCTVTGNRTGIGGVGANGAVGGHGGHGGGIQANGYLNLRQSTISANRTGGGGPGASRGGSGGGIHNSGSSIDPACVVASCTISGNQTGSGGLANLGGDGGGIHNSGLLLVTRSTLAENQALDGGQGGGLSTDTYAPILNNSIVVKNSAGAVSDVYEFSVNITLTGVNLLSSTDGSGLSTGTNLIVDPAPLLASLADNGGPTLTMLPLPGSPAIDAAGASDPGETDQRGFTRFVNGALDIGAVEIQEEVNDFVFDTDGDGYPNGVEQAIGSDPGLSDPAHLNKLQLGFDGNGDPTFIFGYVDDSIVLKLTRSTDLLSYPTIIATASGLSLQNFTDPDPPAGGKAFYRLEATLP
jgi:hypothetical protein